MIHVLGRWRDDVSAAAAAEFVLIFPLLMTMMLGVFELSNAISVNQRSIAAAQIIADLIAREISVDDDSLNQYIRAGELAVEPYDLDRMGVDIISIEFDEDDTPIEVWRETRNMDPLADFPDEASGLGVEGDGALVVAVEYNYRPFFGSMVIDEFRMLEMGFSRGRRTAVVSKND